MELTAIDGIEKLVEEGLVIALRSVLSPCGKSSLSFISSPCNASISFIVSSRVAKLDISMPCLSAFMAS